MKRFNHIFITWTLVLLFLVILFFLYNQLEKENHLYVDLGEDAPIPDTLHPMVEKSKNSLIEMAADQGIEIMITEGYRSFESQNELYEQGRTTGGNIVTNARAGESYHNYGLAIDYALMNNHGELIWDVQYDGNDNGESDWFEVADIAKELGFEWGGDWQHHKDYPHLQMTFGLSIRQLQMGYRPATDNPIPEG